MLTRSRAPLGLSKTLAGAAGACGGPGRVTSGVLGSAKPMVISGVAAGAKPGAAEPKPPNGVAAGAAAGGSSKPKP